MDISRGSDSLFFTPIQTFLNRGFSFTEDVKTSYPKLGTLFCYLIRAVGAQTKHIGHMLDIAEVIAPRNLANPLF